MIEQIQDSFQNWIRKRHIRLTLKWRPDVANQWRSDIDTKVHKEYEKEFDKLKTELEAAQQLLKKANIEKDKYKAKYEESQLMNEKLMKQVEAVSSSKGEKVKEVKDLKKELKETKESDNTESTQN